MAKSRHDSRNNTANSKPSQSRKVDKWEVLRGWTTPEDADETGVAQWADRRRQADERAANERRGHIHVWEPYLCNIVHSCPAIEDLLDFKDNSLIESLQTKPKKDLNVDGKYSQRTDNKEPSNKSTNSASSCDEQKQKADGRGRNDASSQGPRAMTASVGKTDKSASDSASRCTSAPGKGDGGTNHGCRDASATARVKRLIALSQMSSKTAASHHKPGNDEEESPGDCNGTHKYPNRHKSASDTGASSSNGTTSGDEPSVTVSSALKKPEIPPRAVKLSYSQANIILKQPYQSMYGMGTQDPISRLEDVPQEGSRLLTVEGGDKLFKLRDTCSSPSGYFVTSLSDLKENVGSMSELTARKHTADQSDTKAHSGETTGVNTLSNGSSKNDMESGSPENNKVSSEGLECSQVVEVPTVDTLKVSHTMTSSDSASDTTNPADNKASPQRQVSLVLKKVSLQDSNTHDENSSPEVVTTEPQASATRQQPNGLSRSFTSGGELTSLPPPMMQHMVPIGDLLPAVEKNIKNRMSYRANRTSQNGEVDIFALDNDMLGRDRFQPYDDNLMMMKEGMEIMRLKDKHQTMLGPPAFRPQPNKTPLQRAKENTSKRLYGQQNYGEQTLYSEINRLRWQSSSGSLYQGGNGCRGADGMDEVRSAPLTGRLCKRRTPGEQGAGPSKTEIAEHKGKFGSRMIDLPKRRMIVTRSVDVSATRM